MSYTRNQLEIIEDLHSDFDTALSQGKWKEARAIINHTGELFPNEALYMHKTYNRAWNEADVTYVPFEAKVPVMTKFEAHKWAEPYDIGAVTLSKWQREGDEKFPVT